MKVFQFVGGLVSPNAIVVAEDQEQAMKFYNKRFPDNNDAGIGVYELEAGDVVFIGGGDRYFNHQKREKESYSTKEV